MVTVRSIDGRLVVESEPAFKPLQPLDKEAEEAARKAVLALLGRSTPEEAAKLAEERQRDFEQGLEKTRRLIQSAQPR